MITVEMVVWYLEKILLISVISGVSYFRHRAYTKTQKQQKTFKTSFFQSIKTNYPISTIFLSILCHQNTTLKVLRKVIKEHLLLKLGSNFSGY